MKKITYGVQSPLPSKADRIFCSPCCRCPPYPWPQSASATPFHMCPAPLWSISSAAKACVLSHPLLGNMHPPTWRLEITAIYLVHEHEVRAGLSVAPHLCSKMLGPKQGWHDSQQDGNLVSSWGKADRGTCRDCSRSWADLSPSFSSSADCRVSFPHSISGVALRVIRLLIWWFRAPRRVFPMVRVKLRGVSASALGIPDSHSHQMLLVMHITKTT